MQRVDKPIYRFVSKDDTLRTWGVWDNQEGKWVREEVRSSWDANRLAEDFNRDPSLVDDASHN